MRILIAGILAGASMGVAACDRQAPREEPAAEAPAAVEVPSRKPGLWRQTMMVDGVDVLQSVSLCLDAAADKQVAWWGQQGLREGCEKNEVTRNPDGSWSFAAVCTMQGGVKTTNNGRAVGDFQSRYQVTAETTTTGSPMPALNGTRAITIDATWEGECPADMRPGDMELPSGQRMNVLQLSNAAAKG